MAFDLDRAKELALEVWKYKQGEVVSLMIYLGDRLGLYRALAGRGLRTVSDVASELGLDERWMQEWLLGQAAAGLVERHDDHTFSLSDEAASVLVDPESLFFATGAFLGGTPPEEVDRIADSFRTGRGFSYGEMGPVAAAQIDRMNAPWLRNFLIPAVVSQLDGIPERLAAGGRMVDVGCGGGVALEAFAQQYPAATLVGVDPSEPAIEIARERLASYPNVTVYAGTLEELPESESFDFVTTLDCMHDMPRPDLVAKNIATRLADDGAWLIKDIKCAATFEGNAKNPLLAMQYGFSITSCLASATSTDDGLALGTLGFHPERAREIVEAAGLSTIRIVKTDDPAHLYYEVRG